MMNFVQGKVKNLKIKHILLCVFAFFMISSLAFLVTKNLKQIHAYDFSSFNPGNIISDGVMANYNAMSVEEIQRFLTSKNACRDTNIAKARSYPNLRYHVENGRFICLSEETFEYNGQKQTAAQIIFEAARDFQINSQVLIVLLEKNKVSLLIPGQIISNTVALPALVVLTLRNATQSIMDSETKFEMLRLYFAQS